MPKVFDLQILLKSLLSQDIVCFSEVGHLQFIEVATWQDHLMTYMYMYAYVHVRVLRVGCGHQT